MKQAVLLSAFVALALLAAAQKPTPAHQRGKVLDFQLGYVGMVPTGNLSHLGWQSAWQVGLGTRFFRNRLHLGIDIIDGSRSLTGADLAWQMDDRTVNARAWHNVGRTYLGGIAKWWLTQGRGFNGLLLAGAGRFFTDSEMKVYDLDDEHCQLLTERSFVRSSAGYGYVGGGLAWNSGWFLDDEDDKNAINIGIELTVRHQWTGATGQVTVREATDRRAPPPGAEPLDFSFINVQTTDVHQHRVGYRQHERWSGWQLSLGFVASGFTGGRRKSAR